MAFLIIAAVLLILHLAMTWAEGKGWVYYRKGRGSGVALGNAMAEMEALVNPAIEHRIEFEEHGDLCGHEIDTDR